MPVLSKISPIYQCMHTNEPSKKNGRSVQYLATKQLNPDFQNDLNNSHLTLEVTGKVDGTCCYINSGQLLKRRDVKKGKEPPYSWIETSKRDIVTGHWIGFMELERGDKQHLSVINGTYIKTMVIENNIVVVKEIPIDTLEGETVELVGTKIQNDPHQIGNNCVIQHGLFKFEGYPIDFDFDKFLVWFINNCNMFEGIVVHFSNGNMYKIHRHHLDLVWTTTDKSLLGHGFLI